MEQREYSAMDELESHNWWYRGRRDVVGRLLRRHLGSQKAFRTIDIGCGTGEGAIIAKQYGPVVGVDPSDEALRLAAKKGYTSLRQSTGTDLPFASDSFDCAFMLDVLEHIENDVRALAECYRVLAPGGLLFLTVPAHQWLWSGHDEVYGHYRRYSKKELTKKIRAAGFRIVYGSFYVTTLFPFVALYRLVERMFRNKRSSHFFPIPRVVNQFLFGIMRCESMLLAAGIRLPLGSSIVVVAKKTP